ncbi:MAG: PDZ domain-containing protein [Desulfobacula sp.]|uniref:type II secretion system protein N n=1 Tax=Desulfobacula sp. TaxID=2593537 RepID=UPI0025C002EB|nr:type II secretion system protein N [Desulfobacula sp.]MCD4721232.1 PDZ domain-containing protein [Desulfobacula sp.]
MKPLFLFINTLLLISIAYFCVQIFYKHIGKGFFEVDMPPPKKVQPIEKTQNSKKNSFNNQYKKIKDRNLFKVLVEKKDLEYQKPLMNNFKDLKLTDLDLTLWGTVTGTNNTCAVIEDNKNKLQALYQIGDELQGAAIKKILRDKVILTYHHKDYILEMDIKQMPDTSVFQKNTTLKAKEIAVNKSLINSSLKNIDDLKRQARIKPMITKGKSDGLLLYSIKPDSLFHTLGLQNGDIIRQVNGRPTLSLEDAVKIYQNFGNSSKVKVSIFRNGKNQEIAYHIKPDEKAN